MYSQYRIAVSHSNINLEPTSQSEAATWHKPNSTESLEKLEEVLNTAIKERRWTYEPISEGPKDTWPHALYEETAFVIVAPGNLPETPCWMHTFLH